MDRKSMELASPLQSLPPVEFCCAYGSSLLSNNDDRTSMVDCILGVRDPIKWHSQNLEMNRHHYSMCMAGLGPKSVTFVADRIGVRVHFNPFVQWSDKMIKYGVSRNPRLGMGCIDLGQVLSERSIANNLYVYVLVDNWDIRKVNLVNLKSATSAALLLLPPEFTEEDLYAKICSLSYMGDLHMLFAEDKNKVKKIVQGSFQSFRSMYRPMLLEYAAEGLLNSHFGAHHDSFKQDCGLSVKSSLLSSLPSAIHRHVSTKLRSKPELIESCITIPQLLVSSREEAANCIRKALRRKVMVSSGRQAVSGFLAVGGVNAARYLAKKMSKAWKSRAS